MTSMWSLTRYSTANKEVAVSLRKRLGFDPVEKSKVQVCFYDSDLIGGRLLVHAKAGLSFGRERVASYSFPVEFEFVLDSDVPDHRGENLYAVRGKLKFTVDEAASYVLPVEVELRLMPDVPTAEGFVALEATATWGELDRVG